MPPKNNLILFILASIEQNSKKNTSPTHRKALLACITQDIERLPVLLGSLIREKQIIFPQ